MIGTPGLRPNGNVGNGNPSIDDHENTSDVNFCRNSETLIIDST